MVEGDLRVGCSGWSYKDWVGLVYPEGAPSSSWFGHYSSRFDTVELNNTFYRLPSVETVEHWCGQAPDGFCYAVKVGQFGTHRKKLKDPRTWLDNHLDRMRRLGPHLGPNLFQLPPNWKRNVERLDEALAACPDDIRWAVEIRDPSWFHDDVFDCLTRHGAALVVHDLVADHPWERTADWTYVRFHGPDAAKAPYQGRYTGRRLRPVAERLAAWREEGCDVYAYFNNDWNGNAVVDAEYLRDTLQDLAQSE